MYSKISVLIIEDEVLTSELITLFLNELGIRNVLVATNKENALRKIEEEKFDLILLDIRLKGNFDGIEIGKILSVKNTPFVYLTAHSDKEMINLMMQTKSKSFISKPIRKNEFLLNISFILNELIESKENKTSIKNGHEIIKIETKNLIYIKSFGNYIELYLSNNELKVVRSTMENVLKDINNTDFIQTHRSFIINKKFVEKYSSSEVLLKNGIKIPISRNLKMQIKATLT
jgi:two-component system, LytTR family, response regulator LytT